MRTTLFLVSVAALFLSSCSSGNKMQSSVQGDDLYVTQTEQVAPPQQETYVDPSAEQTKGQVNPDPDYSTSDKYTDENGTTYVTNNYYEGQNYDFYDSESSYSSDLSRWYGPSLGFGYFSPFYTSPGFGVSVSFGFGWGNSWYNPYYSPFYSPYYSYYYYNPWYTPYYYGYNPYNPYYGGYYGGGYCGNGYYGGGYYGDGYGYGNNTYYGSHSSSGSNTSNNGDGRHYKYSEDNSGEQNGAVNSSNGSGHAVTPSSSNIAGENANGVSPVKTTAISEGTEIKRNTPVQNGHSSGTSTIKNTPDKSHPANGSSNEIKNVVPPAPVRSVSPSNTPSQQNIQDKRPRTTTAPPPGFEQQRSTNTAANAVNRQVPASRSESMNSLPEKNTSLNLNEGNNQQTQIKTAPANHSSQKIMVPEQSQKQKSISYEKPSKSTQHSNLNVNTNTNRSSSNNGSNSTRSYNNQNSSNSSSSGGNRSSGNNPRR